jgi:hypothetical protein
MLRSPRKSPTKSPLKSPQRRKCYNALPIAFVNDPHQLRCTTLSIAQHDCEQFKTKHQLTTNVVDYLLQKSLDINLPDHILVGSSASFSYMKDHIAKLKSKDRGDVRSCRGLRQRYQYYSLKRF